MIGDIIGALSIFALLYMALFMGHALGF